MKRKGILTLCLWALWPLTSANLKAEEAGRDVNDAIRISLGQTVKDIGDSQLRRDIVYELAVPKGVELIIDVIAADKSKQFSLYLLSPDAKTIQNYPPTLASQYYSSEGRARLKYVTPISSDDYYIWIAFRDTGVAFTLETQAKGVPLDIATIPVVSMVQGQVMSMNHSVLSEPLGLADEIVIGGVRLCSTCELKPPIIPGLVKKLETALYTGVHVEAGFDPSGILVQLKISR